MSEDTMIEALLRERAGYARRGLADRVAEVDEQLKLRGHTPPAGEKPAAARPSRSAPPKGRKPRSSEQA